MRHGVKGHVLTPHKAVMARHWVVPKLPVPHCLGLGEPWLLELYAHTWHGSSLLSTEPQQFSETLGFCEVGTTTVMIWGKPPPGNSRGEHLPARVPLQGRELPRKALRKKGFGSIGWELFCLEVYLAS